MPPTWPDFRDLKTTTKVEPNNPLSANSKKCVLRKLSNSNALQKIMKIVNVFNVQRTCLVSASAYQLLDREAIYCRHEGQRG